MLGRALGETASAVPAADWKHLDRAEPGVVRSCRGGSTGLVPSIQRTTGVHEIWGDLGRSGERWGEMGREGSRAE
eukprot:CAMPEP_0202747346 /NCGR_PEP_ID=MMETSP1388-20130828/8902_1 /ASSEMBLY_ACC=CAM_ASM_000864 /TAXON_ID=37098 /ORGANISM="Isochrysis sp, Strain CCMP1244" /LENGTH=74 /DNA_ID=CAMNT_0049414685 /DNA_START=234 /DNA_END=455 /DNA_ORIENTATION=+